MKAKKLAENFIEISPTLTSREKLTVALRGLHKSFMDDIRTLPKERNIKTDGGLFRLFEELEQKWTAVYNRLEKHYGKPIIVKRGFLKALELLDKPSHKAYLDHLSTNKN